jgi:hypothetical protein
MISTLVFVLLFCVVALLVYMARYSGRVRLEQTRLIDAPLDTVYASVADLRNWQQWSPWLQAGSGADVRLSDLTDDAGSYCAWESASMAAGRVEHLRLLPGERIEQRLRLRHPFAVNGLCYWTFDKEGDKTVVTWTVRARVPFSMRAFAATVKSSLVLDCRYSLDLLASRLEPAGAPRYQITHLGVRDIPARSYVYRNYQGPISGLPEALRSSTLEMRQQLSAHGLKEDGAPIAIYFKTNIKFRTTVCHIGIPVNVADNFGPLPVRELAAHSAYVVRLLGSHTALEIAWYVAMQRMVAEKIQPDQRIPPFESYLVDVPAENDCVTELHLPIRLATTTN